MYIRRWLVLFCFFASCSAVAQSVPTDKSGKKTGADNPAAAYPTGYFNDSSLMLIPFEYKQSALYQPYTFEVIDSIVAILKNNHRITLSIDGFAHIDEGSDAICYYLSLNRARFVRDYILGRGIDSSRIVSLVGYGNTRPYYRGRDEKGKTLNCRVELKINRPPPVKRIVPNRDGDALPDSLDACPDEYGYLDSNGCPNGAVVVPFESQQSALSAMTYHVLDSVITVLKNNPGFTIAIEGHAYEEEGIKSVCDGLSRNRAEMVKAYFLSRYIPASRIDSVNSLGTSRPLNAGRNPMEIIRNSRAELFLHPH
jgi:outer membrane protein OmpA-like peptidoglycan-associated protein